MTLIVGVVWHLITERCLVNYVRGFANMSAFFLWLKNVCTKLYWVFISFVCCIDVLLWYARQVCIRVILCRLIQILTEIYVINTNCYPKHMAGLLSAHPSCISTYPVILSLVQSRFE